MQRHWLKSPLAISPLASLQPALLFAGQICFPSSLVAILYEFSSCTERGEEAESAVQAAQYNYLLTPVRTEAATPGQPDHYINT